MCNLSEVLVENGVERGQEEVNTLNNWLFSQNRGADVQRASNDPDYQKTLFEEMRAAEGK